MNQLRLDLSVFKPKPKMSCNLRNRILFLSYKRSLVLVQAAPQPPGVKASTFWLCWLQSVTEETSRFPYEFKVIAGILAITSIFPVVGRRREG